MHLGYAAIKRVLSEKQVKKLFRRCVDLSRDTSLKESVVLWLRIQALRRTVGKFLKKLKTALPAGFPGGSDGKVSPAMWKT